MRESATSDLGFYDLIDRVCTRVPGIEREELHECIYTSTQPYYSALKATRSWRTATRLGFDRLAGQKDNDSRLEQAVAAAINEHWALQWEWLEDILPPSRDLNLAVASGGTLAFVGDRLKAYLASLGIELERTETDEQELLAALELDSYTQEYFRQINGALRFADVWGVFVAFAPYRLNREVSSASIMS